MNSKQALVPKLRFQGFEGDWQRNTIEELCSNIASGRSKASDLGEYPLYGSTGQIGICSEFDHDGAKILVARVGANAGHLNLVSGKYGVTDNTLIVEPNELVNIRLVFYFFSQFNLNRLIFGSGQPLITGGLLKKINATLPSLPEQEKIAAFLTSVDDRIDQLKRKKSLLQDYKKGAMQKLFSQELRFKDEQGKDFPDWEVKKLGDVAEVISGFSFKSGDFSEDAPNKVIRMSDLKSGRIAQYDHATVGNETVQGLDRFLLREGDFLFGMSGSLSNFAWVKQIDLQAYLNQRVGCLRGRGDNVALFIHYLYLSNRIQNRIIANAVGAAQLNISSTFLRELTINTPSPPEQTQIANFLSSLDQKIEQVDTQITQTHSFKKGLLQQMFV
jgi:type I restriction enzyme S subunit